MSRDGSKALTDLAQRLIEQSGSAASAAANLTAIRSEVERVGRTVAAQPEKQARLAADLHTALIAAGLGDLAPPAAPPVSLRGARPPTRSSASTPDGPVWITRRDLISLQAALLRLERHLAALAAVHVRRQDPVAGA